MRAAAAGLDAGKPARAQGLTAEEQALVRDLGLLTLKKVFYVANVAEKQLAAPDGDKYVDARCAPTPTARARRSSPSAPPPRPRSPALDAADRPAFLDSLGLKEPGLHAVARTAYKILDLITFLTAGEDECRAWTVKRGAQAPQAAGVIHTDFERGFIKAEVIWWEDLDQARLGGRLPRQRQAGPRRQGLRRARRRRHPLQVQRVGEGRRAGSERCRRATVAGRYGAGKQSP